MIQLESIDLVRYAWALIIIPFGWWIKNLLTERKAEKVSLRNDQIRAIVKEELRSIILKQTDLENDFKETNKSFQSFVESFYAKVNEITIKIMETKQ